MLRPRLPSIVVLASGLLHCGGVTQSEPTESRGQINAQTDTCDEAPDDDDLGIELGGGFHAAYYNERFDYVTSGQTCGPAYDNLNSFSLRLTGKAARHYSAVVHCGYLRYDNGTFVGERVEVEARDGEWCDDLALERLQLVDRMLLSDVSFSIEAKDCAPSRQLSLAVNTRVGWTEALPAADSLCVYVADRQAGAYACSLAPPADYCVCPHSESWQDFFKSMKLSLEPR